MRELKRLEQMLARRVLLAFEDNRMRRKVREPVMRFTLFVKEDPSGLRRGGYCVALAF